MNRRPDTLPGRPHPDQVGFAAKPRQAEQMIERALPDLPRRGVWVTADEVYGRDGDFRAFLGVLGHSLRLELAPPIAGHLQLDRPDLGAHRLSRAAVAVIARRPGQAFTPLIAQMLGHLGLQRSLQHRLGDPGQQPIRAD